MSNPETPSKPVISLPLANQQATEIKGHTDDLASKALEELLQTLPHKFLAKVMKIAEETKTTPARVLSEGADLFRKRYRLLHGRLAKRLGNGAAEALIRYSEMQSEMVKNVSRDLSPEAKKARAQKGAKARIASLKKKRK